MEWLGIKGNNQYLINKETNEGYQFDMFGKGLCPVEATYVMLECKVLTPVNVLSILHQSTTGMSEIFFMGKKAIINMSGVNIVQTIPKQYIRESNVIYRIKRTEDIGVNQILIPYRVGELTLEKLGDILKVRSWY